MIVLQGGVGGSGSGASASGGGGYANNSSTLSGGSSVGATGNAGGNASPAGASSTGASVGSNNSSDRLSRTNLYIRGLTPNTTDKDLEELCRKCVCFPFIKITASSNEVAHSLK